MNTYEVTCGVAIDRITIIGAFNFELFAPDLPTAAKEADHLFEEMIRNGTQKKYATFGGCSYRRAVVKIQRTNF